MGRENLIGSLKNKLLKKYEKVLIILLIALLVIATVVFFAVNVYTFSVTVKVNKQDLFASEKYKIAQKYCTVGDTLKKGDKILTLSSETLSKKVVKLANIQRSLKMNKLIKANLFKNNSKMSQASKAYGELVTNHKQLQNNISEKSDSLQRLYNSFLKLQKKLLAKQESLYSQKFSAETSLFNEKNSFINSKIDALESLRSGLIQNDQISTKLLQTRINYLVKSTDYDRQRTNLMLDSLDLSNSAHSIQESLSSKFGTFRVAHNAITITAPQKIVVSYLPSDKQVFKSEILLSYLKQKTLYGEAYVEPSLATILNQNDSLFLSVNTENTGIGKKMISGDIETISITPNKNNKYKLKIDLSTPNSSFLMHGLSGTAFYYSNN